MGLLVEGQWHDTWYDTKSTGGKFKRTEAAFRSWVTHDGSAGVTGQDGFAAKSGRYHLYVSLACPWAHRTLIMRRLKNLESAIDVSVVDPHMGENGWSFEGPEGGLTRGATGDPLHHSRFVHQLYTRALPTYTGRVTVPVLWDKEKNTIVSNESADIIRMFNSGFAGCATAPSRDFYPTALRVEIDAVNQQVYDHVNNGVYKCGFATTQQAYDEPFEKLFATLDSLEARLQRQPYLAGEVMTEADVRLFTTLVRFDLVYYGHFKCNRRALREYPALWDFTRAMYQTPGVAETVNPSHIQTHYYWSHPTINPTRIVPRGPDLNFEAPHSRKRPSP